MKKVITTMLVAAMVLSMAVPTSAATITRKKSTGTTASTTKVSGDYSLKMVDKTLQFIRGGKVVSSIETKDGKITLRKSSAGGISVVFTDANGKRRNITLGKQNSVALSGTFVQVSVDKALGSSFEVEMEKGSKVTNFYAKGAAKVSLNGSVTTLNVTSSNANVAANGTVSRAYAVNKKAISGMSAGKITQTSTGTSASGSVNTSTGSSSSSNTTVNSGSGSGSSSSSGGSSGIIINGGGSNGGTTTAPAPVIKTQPASVEIEKGKSATLTIKATATGKISYQWYDAKTQKAIPNATQESVIVTPTETSSYYCIVTNTVGSKSTSRRSDVAVVKVKGAAVVVDAPEITKHPESKNVEVGTEVTLEVAVKPAAGLTTEYQWYKTDGTVNTKIDGADKAAYTFTPTETGNTTYFCQVVNVDAKGNKSLTVDSDYAAVIVTEKVADTDLAKAKTAIEALKDTEYADLDAVKAAITAAATANGVTADVSGLTLDGTNVAGNVVLSKDKVEETVTVPFTATIKAEPTENADLKAAKEAIEALKGPYADVDAAKAAIKAAVTNEAITVDDSKVALSEDGKTIAGVVGLSIEVDGKPVTATANFSAAVAGQEVEAKAPTFTKDPTAPATGSNITLDKDTPVTLEVAANVDGSTDGITYQWYRSTSSLVDNASARVAIEGATSATYTLAPEDEGSFYFFAEATHTVGDKTASSFSKNVLLTVTVPAGSAVEKPTFKRDLTNGNRGVRPGEQTVLEVEVNALTTPNTTTKYQWYKSTDPENPLNGQPMAGETNSTLTLANNTLGTASYYCVVTNVSTDDVDFNNRTATSKYETITVADTVGMRTVVAVTDATKGTTAIDVTFTKDITGLTAANFKVEGVKDSATDAASKPATPTITVDRVESFTNDLKKYTLHVSGIDLNGQATVEFIAPDGFTVSGTNPQTVNITAPTAPVEVVTVKEFTASKKNAQGETTQLKVTFDKAVSSTTPAYEVVMGDPANPITISKKTIDPADDHSVLLDVTLNSDKDDVEAILTKANDVTLATADQKKVTVERDTTAPTVRSASLTSLNKEIELLMSEPLKAGQTLNKGAFAIADTAGATVTISDAKFKAGSNNTVIVLNADTAIDIRTMTLSYTKGVTAAIIDTAASENMLVDFSGQVIDGTVLPDTLEIQEVEVTAKDTAVVKMNAPIVVDRSVGSLDNLFKATNKTTGSELTIRSVALAQVETKAKALALDPSYNGFTITFDSDLPEDAVVVLSIKDATVAEKIAIAGKEDVKLPPETTVETPEVKSISATVADVTVSGIKDVPLAAGVDVIVTLDNGAFEAIAKDADVASWFTGGCLPTNMTAVAKEAVKEGDTKIVITIGGTPSVTSDAAMEITIPNANITGINADTDLVVTTNANAKFNITLAELDGSFAPVTNLESPISANAKVGAITATGGTGTYTYEIKEGTDTDGNFQVTVSGEVQAKQQLEGGTYTCTVTVSDDASPTPATKEVTVSITVTQGDATEISVSAAKGSGAGETNVTAVAGESGTLKYKTSNATITGVKRGDAEPAGLTDFTSGDPITITTPNTYVHVYEIDNNKVVGYGEHEVAGDEIKCSIDSIALTSASLATGSANAGATAATISTGYTATGVTYTLSGADGAKFAVAGDKINIAASQQSTLQNGTYTITIRATDDANGAYHEETNLTITIIQ